MTTYTVWDGEIPSGTSSTATGERTDGLVFTITSESGSPTLTAVGYYVPVGETELSGSSYTALVWTTVTGDSGTLVTSNVGTGTFTAGAWNFITLTSPVTLSTGVYYVAGISSPDLLQFEHNYWGEGDPGFGGVISGPISVPDATTAPANVQQGNAGSADTFPASTNQAWYGIDIEVLVSASTSGVAVVGGFLRNKSRTRAVWRGGAGSRSPLPVNGKIPVKIEVTRHQATRAFWRGVTPIGANEVFPPVVYGPALMITLGPMGFEWGTGPVGVQWQTGPVGF